MDVATVIFMLVGIAFIAFAVVAVVSAIRGANKLKAAANTEEDSEETPSFQERLVLANQ